MNYIHKTMYINLDRCKERRKHIEHELENMGIKGERFSAIEREPGIIGTGLSHLAAIKRAKAEGWENVFVLEDDFKFTIDRQTLDIMLDSFFKINTSYDVILLNSTVTKSKPFTAHMSYAKDAYGASAYIVHKGFYDTLIANWENAIENLMDTQMYWLYGFDKSWTELQKKHNFLYFHDRIGQPKEMYRHIGKAVSDDDVFVGLSTLHFDRLFY